MPLFQGSAQELQGLYNSAWATACTMPHNSVFSSLITQATTSCTATTGLYGLGVWGTVEQVNQTYANQAYNQCRQISRAEQDRRNAQREQSLYEKAIAEHDEQEAARLRRLIDAREQAAITQRAIDEQNRIDREARIAQQRIEQAAETERRLVADTRANELLFEHLTVAQRKTYNDNGWFTIEGGRTKTKYRIRRDAGLVANVDVLDGDRRVHRLCAHARNGSVPLGDQLLAQKIMLEHDEDAFLRVANRHAA